MESLDINMVRAFLQSPPSYDDGVKLKVARCFIPSSEQVLEIHSAKKNQFNSPEEFLHESILNTYGVNSMTNAEEELNGLDGGLIQNRKASAREVSVVYGKLSPLSAFLPWKILIRDAIILFEDWNIAWLFIETYRGRYVSAKWYTTA